MDIQYNKHAKNMPRIYDDDLQYYGKQLLALVKTYREHMYIPTDEQDNALKELEYYAQMILSRNYDMIITNSKEVIRYEDPLNGEAPF